MDEPTIDRAFGRLRDDTARVDTLGALHRHEQRRHRATRRRLGLAIGAVTVGVLSVVGSAVLAARDGEPEDVRTIDEPPVEETTPTSTTAATTTTPDTATPPTTTPPTTTPPTTTPPPPTTTPGQIDDDRLPEVSRIVAEYGRMGPERSVEPNAGPPGTAGSGCEADDDALLPDGVYFVEVVAEEPDGVVLLPLCFFTSASVFDAGVDRSFEDWEVDRPDAPTRLVPVGAAAPWFLQTVPIRLPGEETATVLLGSATEALEFDMAGARPDLPRPLWGWALFEGGQLVEFFQPQLASA